MLIFPDKYFKSFFSANLLEHGDFLTIDVSQGSVATYLRCGEIFKYDLISILVACLKVTHTHTPV